MASMPEMVVRLTIEDVGKLVDEHLEKRGVIHNIERAQKVLDAAFKLIESDAHQWSDRPCQTCAGVTEIIGRPFGCYNKKARR